MYMSYKYKIQWGLNQHFNDQKKKKSDQTISEMLIRLAKIIFRLFKKHTKEEKTQRVCYEQGFNIHPICMIWSNTGIVT